MVPGVGGQGSKDSCKYIIRDYRDEPAVTRKCRDLYGTKVRISNGVSNGLDGLLRGYATLCSD